MDYKSISIFSSEFEVESITFPGQVHKWRLAKFLQRGTARAEKSLQQVS